VRYDAAAGVSLRAHGRRSRGRDRLGLSPKTSDAFGSVHIFCLSKLLTWPGARGIFGAVLAAPRVDLRAQHVLQHRPLDSTSPPCVAVRPRPCDLSALRPRQRQIGVRPLIAALLVKWRLFFVPTCDALQMLACLSDRRSLRSLTTLADRHASPFGGGRQSFMIRFSMRIAPSQNIFATGIM
jgi:hypothetical protein